MYLPITALPEWISWIGESFSLTGRGGGPSAQNTQTKENVISACPCNACEHKDLCRFFLFANWFMSDQDKVKRCET